MMSLLSCFRPPPRAVPRFAQNPTARILLGPLVQDPDFLRDGGAWVRGGDK
jgi:hypothetical protein